MSYCSILGSDAATRGGGRCHGIKWVNVREILLLKKTAQRLTFHGLGISCSSEHECRCNKLADRYRVSEERTSTVTGSLATAGANWLRETEFSPKP